jgi:hypothetical protein
MRIDAYEFGRISIDGVAYDHDVVIEDGTIRKRKKGPSKDLKEEFGHTPLTTAEKIPWKGRRLWIGTGANGRLPIHEDVMKEARRRGVELLVAPTPDLVARIKQGLPEDTNLIVHVTC